MRLTVIAGAILSLTLTVPLSHPAHATSLSFSSADSVDGAVTPSLIPSSNAAMNTGGVAGLASPASDGAASFDSSLISGAPESAGVSSIGVGTGQFAAAGGFSVRCEVPPPAPSPSVVPEPPTVVLVALGLAFLYWAGTWRREVSNRRS